MIGTSISQNDRITEEFILSEVKKNYVISLFFKSIRNWIYTACQVLYQVLIFSEATVNNSHNIYAFVWMITRSARVGPYQQ